VGASDVTVSTSTVHRGGSSCGWPSHRTASWQGSGSRCWAGWRRAKTYTVCAWMRLQGVAPGRRRGEPCNRSMIVAPGTRGSPRPRIRGLLDIDRGRFTLEVVGTLKGLDLYLRVLIGRGLLSRRCGGPASWSAARTNACAWVDVNTPYKEIEGWGERAWYENC